ncbi:MAG: helix-turn-helix transcriptional regulator [Anaerolineae bacterium]|nr:helix-turn-helix transcriptional regulator [Anaerolineae bacterium]
MIVDPARKQLYNQQTQIFKLLSHPARLTILEILRSGEECVCHMEAVSGYRQAYLSQQLAVLREADIIQDRREGWNIYYRVTRPEIYRALDAIQSMVSDSRPVQGRTTSPHCPCPKCATQRKSS